MKKLLITILASLSFTLPYFAFAMTSDGNHPISDLAVFSCSVNGWSNGHSVSAWDVTDHATLILAAESCDQQLDFPGRLYSDVAGNAFVDQHEYDLLEVTGSLFCQSDYDTCLNSIEFVGTGYVSFLTPSPLSPAFYQAQVINPFMTNIGDIIGAVILSVLALVGLLIAGGWSWRFLKRHIGRSI